MQPCIDAAGCIWSADTLVGRIVSEHTGRKILYPARVTGGAILTNRNKPLGDMQRRWGQRDLIDHCMAKLCCA